MNNGQKCKKPFDAEASKGFSESGGYALTRTGDPIIMSDVL